MLPPKPKKKNNKHVIGKGKKKKNWKDKKRELLIALYDHLWNVAHEDCTNREEQWSGLLSNRCAKSEKYGIKKDYYKSKWETLRSKIKREQALKKVSQDFFKS